MNIKTRRADMNRGSLKYPHWHDSQAHAKRTTMTRSRFLAMTPEEFAMWCMSARERDDVASFFYAMQWPEGLSYCRGSYAYTVATGYKIGLKVENWPTILIDTNETPKS